MQVDFKLEKFMNHCFILQKEKKSLESQIRIELDNWRARAKKGEPTTESRHRLSLYLKKFKAAHETQDILIEREKVRLCSYGKEADSRRVFELKDKLRFFSVLNKQHETLLEMVRQDLHDCRSICRKSKDDDSHVRYSMRYLSSSSSSASSPSLSSSSKSSTSYPSSS